MLSSSVPGTFLSALWAPGIVFSLGVWRCSTLHMTVLIQHCHNIKNQLKTYGDELMINDENIWMVGIGRLWNIIRLYWSLASLYLLITHIYWYIVTCMSFVHFLVPLHQLNTSLCHFHCNESSSSWSKVCCLTENSFSRLFCCPLLDNRSRIEGYDMQQKLESNQQCCKGCTARLHGH